MTGPEVTAAPALVLGAGGHAKVVISCLKALGYTIIGVVDRDRQRVGARVSDVPIVGDDDTVKSYSNREINLVVGIGGLRPRRQVFARFSAAGYNFPSLVHPSAITADGVSLGDGAQVMAGVIVQPDVTIGRNALINTGASIDHDCHIGAHSHVAPGAVLCGGVTVGDGALIGCGARIIPGVTIGESSVVGAGAVVVRDVPAEATVVGVSAQLSGSR